MIDLNFAHIQRNLSMRGYELLLGYNGINDSYVTDVILEQALPGNAMKPLPIINEDAAQMLMDDLWNTGLRPTRNNDTQGEVEFLRNHLGHIIRSEWSE